MSKPTPIAVPSSAAPDAASFRAALGMFATGVTIVTARAADGSLVGLTANSFNSVSLSPPLVLWSLGRASYSAQAFLAATHFAVNVLSAGQIALSRHFAHPSEDKFAGVATREGMGGLPLLADAAAVFECSTEAIHPGGDHAILVGRVERYAYSEREPLVFSRGRYQRGVNIETASDHDADLAAAWGGLA